MSIFGHLPEPRWHYEDECPAKRRVDPTERKLSELGQAITTLTERLEDMSLEMAALRRALKAASLTESQEG